MSIRKTVYGIPERGTVGMAKQAGGTPTLLPSVGDVLGIGRDAFVLGSVYLLATAAGLGTGAGWAAAQLKAHGDRELDTARKSYENQRLRADIGYLKGRIQQEYGAYQKQQQQAGPRSARVLGI